MPAPTEMWDALRVPRPRYSPPLITGRRYPPRLAAEGDRVPVGAEQEWQALDFSGGPVMARLRFGATVLVLRGEDAVLREALQRHWGDFAEAAENEDDGSVDISLVAVERLPFASPVAVPATARRESRLLVKMRGLLMCLDGEGGRASALVERAFPTQDLGNLLRTALAAFSWRRAEWLVRAAAVECGGRGVLLAGAAHAGKSTLARLAAPRPVLTDDTVLVRVEEGRARLATVGFWGMEGSEGLAPARTRRELPLGALLLLEKATANRLFPLPPARAALAFVASIATLPGERTAARAALAFAEGLARLVPVSRLEFHNRDASVWEAIERELGPRV